MINPAVVGGKSQPTWSDGKPSSHKHALLGASTAFLDLRKFGYI